MSVDHSASVTPNDPSGERPPATLADGLDRFRLPRTAVPSNYQLQITPDLEAGTFSGSVSITLEVLSRSEQLVLNSDELEISNAAVNGTPASYQLDSELERLSIDHTLEPGPALLTLDFKGQFNPQLVGFYLSSFTDSDGVDRKIATTQFESTYARKAFPCWDEPDFKATFDLTLVAPKGMDAISNSAETNRSAIGDAQEITFATTMIMSTYLVAYVIGDLEMTEPSDVDGVDLRVVHVNGAGSKTQPKSSPILTGDYPAPPSEQETNTDSLEPDPNISSAASPNLETIDLTAFALECGAFGLRYFSNYFNVPYPGDKVDLVAVPDFAMGAMENLGCITFRESLLLVDPLSSTQSELQRVADVIFHELAHMWFGDLVTMKWWNGLWLNEAFATFMEMRCTDAFRPEWQRWVDFGLSRTAAFDVDALVSTRPIEFDVVSPADAEGMFDILTYEKGAAVVRMLELHLGEEQFQAGIRHYMDQHAYGNTETTDLWDAIESQTSQPVRAIMDSWIFQGGAPIIYTDLAQNGRSVTFTQERLRYHSADPSTGNSSLPPDSADSPDQIWIAPIRYRWKPVGQVPVTATILLDSESAVVELPDEAEWLVANAEGASYLRVFYPPEALDALGAVAFDALLPIERYALVDDAWAAVLADSMSATAFLALLESLTAETDRSVWQRLLAGFKAIDKLLESESRANFQAIAHDAMAPALAGLTLSPLDDDDSRARQLRGDLIRAMGTTANDLEIQQEAQRTVAEGRRDPALVEASIMSGAIDVTASLGDSADLQDYLESFNSAATPQEQLRFLYATADFPSFDQLKMVFNLILDGEIRAQNAPLWINRALSNRANGPQVWQMVQDNWDALGSIIPTGALVRMLGGIASLTAPTELEQVAVFFDQHPIPQGEKTLSQLLERQRVGAALRHREAARTNAILAP